MGGCGRLRGAGAAGRQDDREALQQEYTASGLTRRLSPLDLLALECQAGFPLDAAANPGVTISQQQWDDFLGQFKATLQLLRQMPQVWNREDPCVIAGFDMDDQGAAQALALEPHGSCIVRFSVAQPGSLLLTCKVGPEHAGADEDGLLQGAVSLEQLAERRLEAWLRDLSDATHVLDVYTNRRVDKRRVCSSSVARLRAMDPLDAYADVLI